MPVNPEAETQATRQMYIDRILECQLPDGGWSLFGGTDAAGSGDGVSDPDITGMALQALAKYQDQPAVAEATEEALVCMSEKQSADGGFASWGTANSESVVQMIVALCELGISLDDPRFVKNGNTMLDNLMTFYLPGNGFLHTVNGSGSNQMATEQAFYGMVAAQRARQNQNSLYRMGDAIIVAEGEETPSGTGLEGKHADVKAVPVTSPGKTFDDITGANAHANQPAIEALAARGIIDGMGDGLFHPAGEHDPRPVRRYRGAGPRPDACRQRRLYRRVLHRMVCPYVGTASTYGLINGVGEGRFNPDGTITKQEAAVMVARAAKLCGMDTELDTAAVRDVLAQFTDYVTTSEWAREGLAFCYQEGILDDSAMEIQGKTEILRCEIAQMLYNLLGSAKLL
mgnify:FL=1